jgi:hypothetical protein
MLSIRGANRVIEGGVDIAAHHDRPGVEHRERLRHAAGRFQRLGLVRVADARAEAPAVASASSIIAPRWE